MELPIVQYKRNRFKYKVAAIFGLLVASVGFFWFAREDISSHWAWIFLVIGCIVSSRCGWMATNNALVLELNHEGIQYKSNFYRWDTFRSYAIREEIGETATYNYLILNITTRSFPLKIQLDWLKNNESVPEQMAAYASAFQIKFDGVTKFKYED